METITFRRLAQHIAEKSGLPRKEVLELLRLTSKTVVSQVKKGNKVRLTGLGSFVKVVRNPRKTRNPQTGEEITTVKHNAPKFKASKAFKATVY